MVSISEAAWELSLDNSGNKVPSALFFRKTFPYTTWTMTMIHHRFRQPSLLFSTDHSPIWWKVHSQCSSNFSFSGFVGPETSLPMGLNSMDVADICRWHRIFGSVYMPSIGDSWPVEEVTKNIFSTSNTSHLIIMMISVVLCKINKKINYLSIFHDHVVRIWLRNWPAKLSWNRNKNS